MSANADVIRRSAVIVSSARDAAAPQVEAAQEESIWNTKDFTRHQIRGLVQRIFFANGSRAIRQVVFSAVDPQLDVAMICELVARALALETRSQVALVGREQKRAGITHSVAQSEEPAGIKSWSVQMTTNLWRVPNSRLGERCTEPGTGLHWLTVLAELRSEFEYVILEGSSAGTSSEAALLGPLTDGIILVLGAGSTRRATALKVKENLEGAQSRILGTVLSGRTFPIPERIYRRL
jgi:hypothetical protein